MLLLALLLGALAPLRNPSHERSFTFPAPASKQAAARAPALPREIRLTLGVQDVLLLRNLDRRPHVVGPLQLRPGQEVRLPFEFEGAYAYACPEVAGGTLTVRVVRLPDPGLEPLALAPRRPRQWLAQLAAGGAAGLGSGPAWAAGNRAAVWLAILS